MNESSNASSSQNGIEIFEIEASGSDEEYSLIIESEKVNPLTGKVRESPVPENGSARDITHKGISVNKSAKADENKLETVEISLDQDGVPPNNPQQRPSEDHSPETTDSEDELVQLRGEGRYFGTVAATEVLGPVCRNCHERGHIAAQCRVVICESCGERNNHYTRHCPKLQKCTNCGEAGHLRSECKSRSRIIFCNRCESRNHTDDRCPDIWRSYKLAKRKPHYPESISCYNCARKGHYGDECRDPRTVELRYVEESAFTGKNLPVEMSTRYEKAVKSLVPTRPRSLYGFNSTRATSGVHDRRETQSIADTRGTKSSLKRKVQELGGKAKNAFKRKRH
jgi:protein AIR1/2